MDRFWVAVIGIGVVLIITVVRAVFDDSDDDYPSGGLT